jgi:hypothetical protein
MNHDASNDPNPSRPPRFIWLPTMVYLGLLVIGIPWYWPTANHSIIFGMPGWVNVAIGASIVASIFTASLLWAPWPSEADAPGKAGDRSTP